MQHPDPVFVFKVNENVSSISFFNQFILAGCKKSVKLLCLSVSSLKFVPILLLIVVFVYVSNTPTDDDSFSKSDVESKNDA